MDGQRYDDKLICREGKREREFSLSLREKGHREREMSGERKRTVKLFCPFLSKSVVPFVAWDEQRLDLGSIARAFGIDPATLKLNGHFISRGVDLIASSVTWKSLLSFFSSHGLSTGATDADALIVDGKLSRVGTKRAHDVSDVENGGCYAIIHQNSSVDMRPPLEDTNFLKKKKLMESSSGSIDGENSFNKCDGFGLKRKQCLEYVSPLKRIRMAGTNSGSQPGENGISRRNEPSLQSFKGNGASSLTILELKMGIL